MSVFNLTTDFKPAGDQPEAIKNLVQGIKKGLSDQTLLGVTGSGKTFTAANVIAQIGKPTLVIAHNKTLAAQLAQEYRDFFPNNAVHYFVSYYDYYQPEAYVPTSDTYIEKEAQINEEIDRLRHASTQALLTRSDVIIVASVSCIYGLGSPEEYEREHLWVKIGEKTDRQEFMRRLVGIFYERTPSDLKPGTFRATGNRVEIMPPSEIVIYRILFEDEKITEIEELDAITRQIKSKPKDFFLFPAKHYITTSDERARAISSIKLELEAQLKKLQAEGKILEAERLKRRTNYDLALINEIGYCNGIENYSRHLSGRKPGEAPETLLSYFPKTKDGRPDFLTIVDESHVALPQLRGMHTGDASRKRTLIEHGFRLPSALDNRPLKFEEFRERVGQIIYTSATPADYEKEASKQIVEQIIRPTGLVDPKIEVRPVTGTTSKSSLSKSPRISSLRSARLSSRDSSRGAYPGQVRDFINDAVQEIKKANRVIATTLTKKMAEDLASFLKKEKVSAEYLHSEIETLDRIKILTDFRKGKFDCLVGVNLLREGLDLPEVTLIGILDADKEGFLRSETSLIQIIGRAARNVDGRVILYADNITGSMKAAIGETERRRVKQLAYNKKHNITPKTIKKQIKDITETLEGERERAVRSLAVLDLAEPGMNKQKLIRVKTRQLNDAVKELDFETAAILRDEILILQNKKPKKQTKSRR